MDLQTYLTKSSSRPNKQVLQSLGATEEQIEYIMETPENFNWNVWDGLSNVSDEFLVLLGGKTDEESEQALINSEIPVQATPKELVEAKNNNMIFHCRYTKYFGNTLGYLDDGETPGAQGVLVTIPTITITNNVINFEFASFKTISYPYTEDNYNKSIIIRIN